MHKLQGSRAAGHVTGGIRLLLRLEAVAVFGGAVWLYGQGEANWWLFTACFLLPDLSFIGYLRGPAVGAASYNAAHSYLAPAAIAGMGILTGGAGLQDAALLWFAHIGFDRMLGYGLKYPGGFASTHLGKIGRQSDSSPEHQRSWLADQLSQAQT